MKIKDIEEAAGVGRITRQNQTADVGPDEVKKQAAKWGFKVNKDGYPPLLHSKAAKNSTPNKLYNLGLAESRGVTARGAGERYVNDKNKDDYRTIVGINIIAPQDAPAFQTNQELTAALKKAIPSGAKTIDDNKMGIDSRAAIVATVSRPDGGIEHWIRYIKAVPPAGVHGLWKTLAGYSYDNPRSKSEKLKIKPSDLISDPTPRNMDQLVKQLQQSVNVIGDEELDAAMTQAITQAAQGKPIVVKNGATYAAAMAKYAGEYLGVIELLSGRQLGGDLQKAMSALGIKTFAGSTVAFPQGTLQELYDSIIKTPDGKTVQISTKMEQKGSSSSLSGVVNQLTPEISERYPKGTAILKMLGTGIGANGVINAAVNYGIITKEDAGEINAMDKSSKQMSLVSKNLQYIFNKQKIRPGSYERMGYTARRHMMAALANTTIARINQDDEVLAALQAALNNNNYLQIVTQSKIVGPDLHLDFSTKFPTEFRGKPKLVNSAFWSTGEQGRITFVLP